MIEFILVVVIAVAIFVVTNMRNSHRQDVMGLSKPVLNSWVLDHNGVLDSLMLTTVRDDQLSVHPGAHMFIGRFKRDEGKDCGFYVEILDGEIVLGRIFFPDGITSWHKNLSMQAKLNQTTLLAMLEFAEEEHHKKFPEWRVVR